MRSPGTLHEARPRVDLARRHAGPVECAEQLTMKSPEALATIVWAAAEAADYLIHFSAPTRQQRPSSHEQA